MGYEAIDKNARLAARVVQLIGRMDAAASDCKLECTFALAAASLLLCQTSDRAREELRVPKPSDGKALDESDAQMAARVLVPHIRSAAVTWLCSWKRQTRVRLAGDRSPFGDWLHLKYRLKPGEAASSEVFESALLSERSRPLAEDVPKYRVIRIIRNALAHGGVSWTTGEPPESRARGVTPVSGILFASLATFGECERCGQTTRNPDDCGKHAEYDLLHAPISGFQNFILDWAMTLQAADINQGDIDLIKAV